MNIFSLVQEVNIKQHWNITQQNVLQNLLVVHEFE